MLTTDASSTTTNSAIASSASPTGGDQHDRILEGRLL
jgi:hypothetical protein